MSNIFDSYNGPEPNLEGLANREVTKNGVTKMELYRPKPISRKNVFKYDDIRWGHFSKRRIL